MADYRILKPFILKWEGGFVNDPNDSGGATNKGVTLATFRKYKGASATVDDLKAITDEDWTAIFKQMYWDKCRADNIASQAVANLIVDWYWMSGTNAIKYVQRLIGTTEDGIVGKQTIALLNAKGDRLAPHIYNYRKDFYHRIVANRPTQKRFLRGWLNRLNALMEL